MAIRLDLPEAVGPSRHGVPRIFVEPGGYEPFNVGDEAMLDVAIARIRSQWPHAPITIHSLDANWVHRFDGALDVLDPWGSRGWSVDALLIRPSGRIPPLVERALDASHRLRRSAPRLVRIFAEAALRSTRRRPRLVSDYLGAVRGADLVIVTGAGALNDSFKRHAFVVLETLELAIEANAVTAVVGQGIGPITEPMLRKRAAAILPRVSFIALREKTGSLPLIESMGVPPERIAVTGDDAIAVAYAVRRDSLGSAIGVNLRASGYSGMGGTLVARIGSVVREAAHSHAAELLAVPISRHPEADDLRAVQPLLDGLTQVGTTAPSSPGTLLSMLAGCRIIVAGSYHAAVLALSMGIPAVTIAASDYYQQKFRGLAGQFGPACRVEVASHPDFLSSLRTSIDDAWTTAHATRNHLLDAAAGQIELSKAAYRRIADLVEHERRPAHR